MTETDHRKRWRNRLHSARRSIMAAIGVGVAGAITVGITGLPEFVSDAVNGPPEPLTVAGSAAPLAPPTPTGSSLAVPTVPTSPASASPSRTGVVRTTELCDLGGTYVLPGRHTFARPLSSDDLRRLIQSAGYSQGASGSYTLQAMPGQTVVVTGIHTVVTNRVEAPYATVVSIESICSFCIATLPGYYAKVDLDSNDLAPVLTSVDGFGVCGRGKVTPIESIETVVTNETPLRVHFSASTSKYDVMWKFRIDYTVNGKIYTGWIQNGSEPFHAIAVRPDDKRVLFRHKDGLWTATTS